MSAKERSKNVAFIDSLEGKSLSAASKHFLSNQPAASKLCTAVQLAATILFQTESQTAIERLEHERQRNVIRPDRK